MMVVIMAQLIVRDVDEAVAQALRLRAAANGRSVEAEPRLLLREALGVQVVAEDFAAAAARLRARLARGTDSAELVREGRDDRP
jgi:plasmid stability protein